MARPNLSGTDERDLMNFNDALGSASANVPELIVEVAMSLPWVLIIAGAIFGLGIYLLRSYQNYSTQRWVRYIDTPAWDEARWNGEHERKKIAQQRHL